MPAFARLSRGLRALAAAALFLIPLGGATAAPAHLANDADVAAFAAHIKAYAGASRAQWVVAAPDAGLADAVLTAIRHHLGPRDQSLLDRIRTEIQPASGQAKAPVGWMEPRIGGPASEQPCSWQVWVSDASIPSPQAQPVRLPLASSWRTPSSATSAARICA